MSAACVHTPTACRMTSRDPYDLPQLVFSSTSSDIKKGLLLLFVLLLTCIAVWLLFFKFIAYG
jgi:hypothetical protein